MAINWCIKKLLLLAFIYNNRLSISMPDCSLCRSIRPNSLGGIPIGIASKSVLSPQLLDIVAR